MYRLVAFFLVANLFMFGAGAATKSPSIPDLTGDWVSDSGGHGADGVTIHVDFFNSGSPTLSNYVTKGGDCPYGGHRRQLFDSPTFQDANTMTGKIEVCTLAKVLIDKCGLEPNFTVDFKTQSISKDAIIGTLTMQWYDPVPGDECKFTPNPAKDKQVSFKLTRAKANPCPDTSMIKQYSQISNRAVGIINGVASKTNNANIKTGLGQAQNALNTISRGLTTIVEAGDKCDQINSVLNDILEFEAAIDQINGAGCNSASLAGGFDNLFQSAGRLGNAFNPFPELGPAFTILAQDQNFFSTVSGELNPEQRWADQFQNVDGYVPNCTQ